MAGLKLPAQGELVCFLTRSRTERQHLYFNIGPSTTGRPFRIRSIRCSLKIWWPRRGPGRVSCFSSGRRPASTNCFVRIAHNHHGGCPVLGLWGRVLGFLAFQGSALLRWSSRAAAKRPSYPSPPHLYPARPESRREPRRARRFSSARGDSWPFPFAFSASLVPLSLRRQTTYYI